MAAAVLLSAAAHGLLLAYSPRIRIAEPIYYVKRSARPFVVTDRRPAPEPKPSEPAAPGPEETAASTPAIAAMNRQAAADELARILAEEDLLPPPPPAVAELTGIEEAVAPPDIDLPPGETLPRQEILSIPEPKVPELEPELPRKLIPDTPRTEAIADLVAPALAGDVVGTIAAATQGRPVVYTAVDEPPVAPEIVGLQMRADLGDVLRDLAVAAPEPVAPAVPEPPPPPPLASLQGESAEPLDPFLRVDLYTYVSPEEPDLGYFMIQIGARPDRPLRILPKDIFFVIDSSNSMTERKLEKCKEGLKLCLQQLGPRDRFNVATFKAEPIYFRRIWVEPDPREIAAAIRFVDDLHAGGQTDIYGSLEGILGLRREIGGRPIIVYLISDGKPTTGLVDSSQIINRLTRRNRRNISVYCFAGGANVNLYLLDLLAYRNQGESRYVRSLRDVPEAIVDFYNEFADPTVTDLEFRFTGIDPADVVPTVLPHLYAGRRLTIYGRYPTSSEALGARIVGSDGRKRHELIFSRRFESARPAAPELSRAWAAQKIYALIGRLTDSDDPAVRTRIAALSERYGIETPYQNGP